MNIRKVNQQALFSYTLNDLPSGYKITQPTLSVWYKSGYLSFDPNKKAEFSEIEFQEFRFIATLFKSGISLISIDKLLEKMKKPYAYDITKIYFNWIKREWEYLPDKPEINVFETVDTLIAAKETGILTDLQEKINSYLSIVPKPKPKNKSSKTDKQNPI
jgi:hypothetical protein